VSTISRFDKYNGVTGGFRAKLDVATVPTTDVGKVWAVGLNANGRVVKGAGVTGIIGVICPTRNMAAGEVIDVMTDGEIVEFTLQSGAAAAAGTRYFGVAASGDFNTTNTGSRLGWTVELDRLIVRVGRGTNPTT
jgi:hypothetical protein